MPDEITSETDLQECRAAWFAAVEAISAAWKITPEPLLKARTPINGKIHNQTISYIAAEAMVKECTDAIRQLKIDAYERSQGR